MSQTLHQIDTGGVSGSDVDKLPTEKVGHNVGMMTNEICQQHSGLNNAIKRFLWRVNTQ